MTISQNVTVKVEGLEDVVAVDPNPIVSKVERGETHLVELNLHYIFSEKIQKIYNAPRWQLTDGRGYESSWNSGKQISDSESLIQLSITGYTSQFVLEVRQQAQKLLTTHHKLHFIEKSADWEFSDHVINDSVGVLHTGTVVPQIDCVLLQDYRSMRTLRSISFVQGSFQATGDDPEEVPSEELPSPSHGVVRIKLGKNLSADKNYTFNVMANNVVVPFYVSTKPNPHQRTP